MNIEAPQWMKPEAFEEAARCLVLISDRDSQLLRISSPKLFL